MAIQIMERRNQFLPLPLDDEVVAELLAQENTYKSTYRGKSMIPDWQQPMALMGQQRIGCDAMANQVKENGLVTVKFERKSVTAFCKVLYQNDLTKWFNSDVRKIRQWFVVMIVFPQRKKASEVFKNFLWARPLGPDYDAVTPLISFFK